MPNWCSNVTELLGSEADIKEILRRAKTTQYELDEVDGELKAYEVEFSMNGLVPMPEHLQNTQSNAGGDDFAKAIAGDQTVEYKDWYHWRLAHWGTKWDLNPETTSFSPLIVQDDNASIEIYYDTAWSPVCEFWQQVSKLFPNVRIDNRYLEEGCDFIGQAIFEGGEVLADHCQNISAEDYVKAGAVLNEEGLVDWDIDQDYDLFTLFPLVEV